MEQNPNMMPNGMQMQNINSMQRPQRGNQMQQLYAKVLDDLKRQQPTPQGWQTTFDIGHRAAQIFQIISQLKILEPDISRCVSIAENYEERTIREAPSKEAYHASIQEKLKEIQRKREEAVRNNMQNGQLGPPMGMNGNMLMQNNMGNQNPNMNMMQNPGMNGMGMNMSGNMNFNQGNGQMGMNGMQQNQNFPTQLQRQMQPSPLPQHLQGQPQNDIVDPAALRQMQSQMPNMNPQASNMNQNGQNQPIQPTQEEVRTKARAIFAGLTEERKNQLRQEVLRNMSEQQKLNLQHNNQDPLHNAILRRARDMVFKEKNGLAPPPGQQSGNGMPMQNPMQGSMSMAANNLQQTSQPDFSTITGLQANAIRSQESGGEVVPASNHQSFNMGGQANMNQGVNPQMLGNPNGQPNNNANMQQMKMAQQMQRQQQQQLQNNQNHLARQQALAQQAQAQNHLRGQPGGLSTPNALNGGQVNSPAMNMSMLNRPMVPPGQTTPSTPQQNRPNQGMSQTPMNGASQLAQHHQAMLNQNQNQGQGQNQNNQQLQAKDVERLLSEVPPRLRDTIKSAPPAQIPAILSHIMSQQQQQQQQQGGNQNQNTMNPFHPQPPGGLQMGNSQTMGNGAPPNMGNAIPNFMSQPPPNQQQQQRPNQEPFTFQKMEAHQAAQVKQRAMDMHSFPKHILQQMAMQVGPEIDTWGKLKSYVMSNQSVLPPNTMDKLNNTQHNWFDTHPEDMQNAHQDFQRRWHLMQQRQQLQQRQHHQQQQQQQNMQTSQPPSSMPMQTGPAPPAQMVPPVAPMQQPLNQNPNMPGSNMPGPNMGQGQMRPPQMQHAPTDEEVKQFRARVPQAQGQSDDHVRQMMVIVRRRNYLQNAQMRSAGLANNAGPAGNAPQADQQQPARAQQGQKQQGQAEGQGQGQGQKRPQSSSDDIIEIKNPSAPPANNAPKPPPMQQTGSQQMNPVQMFGRPLTQEQLNNMTPQQRQSYQLRLSQVEAIRRAQSTAANGQANANQPAPPQPPPAPQQQQQAAQAQLQAPGPDQAQFRQQTEQKVKEMWMNVYRNTPKGPAVQISPPELEQAQAILKKLYPLMTRIASTFPAALNLPTLGEKRLLQMMKIRAQIQHNTADASGKIKDYLSLSLPELQQMQQWTMAYFAQMTSWQKSRQQQPQVGGNGAQAQQAQPQPQAPPPVKQEPAPQAPPLNRKISQTGHGRKQSSSTKAPPAPTDEKKFDWGAPSPHGIPKYEAGRTELTPDKLKIPPPKRRKTGQSESQTSTPAAQTGTPGGTAGSPGVPAAAKAPTPEQVRRMQMQQAQAKPVEPVRPRFRCEDALCERSIGGFESEEALKRHREEEHRPIEDPFQFLMDLTEEVGEVEKEDPIQARNKAAVSDTKAKPTPAPNARAASKAPSTPLPKQPKSAEPAPTTAAAKSPSLLDTMVSKLSFPLPPTTPSPTNPTTDDFPPLLFNPSSPYASNSWDDFAAVTNWNLPRQAEAEAELTPSSVDSQSSRESDVSESARLKVNLQWDAFGDGDTGVPEWMVGEEGLGGLGFGEGEEMDWRADEGGVDWGMVFGDGGG
ncbi:uncharacterized protein LTR77_008871 [Saxophila tyrrhenica]|uniref:Mediator complex subunit 15 KIX domain-containing protein n=1 Tax=Saxophila tyrrhenica TaxID=1690608 RepID=A0AAV9P0I6_9PEZI|nr:hypothetical protein LTR77_008871 [Saxophila tyrrhenica]